MTAIPDYAYPLRKGTTGYYGPTALTCGCRTLTSHNIRLSAKVRCAEQELVTIDWLSPANEFHKVTTTPERAAEMIAERDERLRALPFCPDSIDRGHGRFISVASEAEITENKGRTPKHLWVCITCGKPSEQAWEHGGVAVQLVQGALFELEAS